MRHFQPLSKHSPIIRTINIISFIRPTSSIQHCTHRFVPLTSYSRCLHTSFTSLSENQTIKPPTNQTNNQSVNQSVNQPVNQSTSQTTSQTTDQSATQTVEAVRPIVKESKIRRLFRQYGAVAVGTYASMYVSTLGMIYVCIHNGWVGSVDVEHWIEWLGVSSHFENLDTKNGGDFLVAWLATKLTEPIRLAVTVAITPALARMLGRAPTKAQNAAAKEAAKQEKAKQEADESNANKPS